MSGLRWILRSCVILGLAGLAMPAHAEEGAAAEKLGVAIVEFSDKHCEVNGLGPICSSALAQALSARFTVVEREKMKKVMEELKLQNSGLVNAENAAKIGELLAVKYLVYGDIQRAQRKKDALGVGIGMLGGGVAKATVFSVEVAYKATDVQTGETIWQQTVKKDERVPALVEQTDDVRENLGKALAATAQEFAKVMVPKIQGVIADVDAAAGTLLLNRGAKQGVYGGQLFQVIRKGKEIKDPETGAVLKVEKTQVCLARCKEASDTSSTLEIGEQGRRGFQANKAKGADLKVGDQVESLPAPTK